MRHVIGVWMLVGLLGVGAPVVSAQSTGAAPAKGPDVDNTRMNKVDRNDTRPTPQNQSGAKADRLLTAAVRKAIVKDKSLSTYAHNVKVITRDGVVTLRGPVQTSEEKTKVAELAQQVSGVSKVDDQLLVKKSKKS